MHSGSDSPRSLSGCCSVSMCRGGVGLGNRLKKKTQGDYDEKTAQEVVMALVGVAASEATS